MKAINKQRAMYGLPALTPQQEEKVNLEKAMFFQLCEILAFQSKNVKPAFFKEDKADLSNLEGQLEKQNAKHRNQYKAKNPKGFETYLDSVDGSSAFIIDVLKELAKSPLGLDALELIKEANKSKNPLMPLALLRSFNEGDVKAAGRGNHKPANEMSLEEFEKKAA